MKNDQIHVNGDSGNYSNNQQNVSRVISLILTNQSAGTFKISLETFLDMRIGQINRKQAGIDRFSAFSNEEFAIPFHKGLKCLDK